MKEIQNNIYTCLLLLALTLVPVKPMESLGINETFGVQNGILRMVIDSGEQQVLNLRDTFRGQFLQFSILPSNDSSNSLA